MRFLSNRCATWGPLVFFDQVGGPHGSRIGINCMDSQHRQRDSLSDQCRSMMMDVCIQFGSFEMFQTNFRQVHVFS